MFTTLAEALERGRGIETPFLCPSHRDTRPSASVNRLKGLWYCYSCGASGTTAGVELPEDDDHLVDDIFDMLKEPKVYAESWLDSFDAGDVHPYWLGRFTEATCRRFRLGWDYEWGSACYPFRGDGGAVLGLVHRVDAPGQKYHYPVGIRKQLFLFNHDQMAHDTVYLVESATTAMAAYEAGITAYGIYGSSYSRAQADLVRKNSPSLIVCAFDNDRSGRKATEMVVGAHGDTAVVGVDWSDFDDEVSDLGDLGIEDRKRLLDPIALGA